MKVYAISEGTLVEPRVPLLRIEGPLAVCQLLGCTCSMLINIFYLFLFYFIFFVAFWFYFISLFSVETSLLNLVNYATLMATNAARFRISVGKHKSLV